MRIADVAVLFDQRAAHEVARKRWVVLTQLVGVELRHDDSVVAPEFVAKRVLGKGLLGAIKRERALALDEVRATGIPRQRQHGVDRRTQQAPERTRLRRDAVRGSRPDETDEPGCQYREIAPADREWTHRIEQPAWHVPERPRH